MLKRPKKRRTKTAPSASPPYKGELASPIVEPHYYRGLDGGIGSIPPHKGPLSKYQAQQRVSAKQAQKLDLLFEWYQIDKKATDRWLQLSIALALAHVPGMKVIERSRSPKPSFWKDGGFRALVEGVDRIRLNGNMTIPQAIEQLKKENPDQWQKRTSLESRLTEARVFVAKEDARNRARAKKIKEESDKFTEELRVALSMMADDDLANGT
jgi:hypothetical protein